VIQIAITTYLLIGVFFAIEAVKENKEVWHPKNLFFVFLINLLMGPVVGVCRAIVFILDHIYVG
jgi:hypothetical protein